LKLCTSKMSGVSPLKSKSQTDWNKCFLCRTEKKGEDLKTINKAHSDMEYNYVRE
jgi:hypothetical protein